MISSVSEDILIIDTALVVVTRGRGKGIVNRLHALVTRARGKGIGDQAVDARSGRASSMSRFFP